MNKNADRNNGKVRKIIGNLFMILGLCSETGSKRAWFYQEERGKNRAISEKRHAHFLLQAKRSVGNKEIPIRFREQINLDS